MEETRYAFGPGDRLRGLFVAASANVVLGLVVALVPWLAATEADVRWSNVVAGLLVAGLAAWQARAAWSDDVEPSRWISVVNLALALWIMGSPVLLGSWYGILAANATLGLMVALLASYNAWVAGHSRRTRPLHRTGF